MRLHPTTLPACFVIIRFTEQFTVPGPSGPYYFCPHTATGVQHTCHRLLVRSFTHSSHLSSWHTGKGLLSRHPCLPAGNPHFSNALYSSLHLHAQVHSTHMHGSTPPTLHSPHTLAAHIAAVYSVAYFGRLYFHALGSALGVQQLCLALAMGGILTDHNVEILTSLPSPTAVVCGVCLQGC